MTKTKKFQKNDDGFICQNCNKEVLPLIYTSRDHCPYCLCSKHVDIMPGDRKNTCCGLLEPIGLEIKGGKEKIVYRCNKCLQIHKNVVADDDNRDLIIKLSSKPLMEI